MADLRNLEEITSTGRFDTEAVRTTALGKSLTGTYLARNVTEHDLGEKKFSLIIGSALDIQGCTFSEDSPCQCINKYVVPIKEPPWI